jgi:hypothetical protein
MMWNETVKANCIRDIINADMLIVAPLSPELAQAAQDQSCANARETARRRAGEIRQKQNRARRRDLLKANLTIWTATVHCTLVAADVAMVSNTKLWLIRLPH